DQLAGWIAEDGRKPGAPLFDPCAISTGLRLYRKDLAHAGIPYKDKAGRVADIHAMRMSFASHLRRAGVDVGVAQRLLRHSDPRLTLRTYQDPALLDLREAVGRLPEVK